VLNGLSIGTPVTARGSLLLGAGDVDEGIGGYAEPDPAPHSVIAFVSAAIEPVPSFSDADASLASGPPPLASAEPALSLFALRALGRAIGHADALDALGFQAANPSTAHAPRQTRLCTTLHCGRCRNGRSRMRVAIVGPGHRNSGAGLAAGKFHFVLPAAVRPGIGILQIDGR
jgi:hypothetical protein